MVQDIVAAHRQFYGNLWRFWPLIVDLAKRDLTARYRGSYLGFLWSFMNPLLLMLTYAVIFGYVSRVEMEFYPLYVLIGVLVWQCMSASVNESAYSLQGAHNLVSKTPLPAEVIPVKVVISQMLNFCLGFVVYLASSMLFFKKFVVFWAVFPIFFAFLLCFLAFVAVPVAVLSTIYRDFQQLVSNILTVLFFTTPVVYDYAILPRRIQNILLLNPFTQVIRVAQDILFRDRWPPAPAVAMVILMFLFLEVAAVYICSRYREVIAEKV